MKSKELSLDKREVIENIKADGYKISYFSRMLSVHESTFRSVFKNTRCLKTVPRSGRARKGSERGEAELLCLGFVIFPCRGNHKF